MKDIIFKILYMCFVSVCSVPITSVQGQILPGLCGACMEMLPTTNTMHVVRVFMPIFYVTLHRTASWQLSQLLLHLEQLLAMYNLETSDKNILSLLYL